MFHGIEKNGVVYRSLYAQVSGIIDKIVKSPHLYFAYDPHNCVYMVSEPERRNGQLAETLGVKIYLRSSIEVVAPGLSDNEAHAEVIRRLGEPTSCEVDIQGTRNLRYSLYTDSTVYLFYVSLLQREDFKGLEFRRLRVARKSPEKNLVDKLCDI